jgi:hypothetical protein
MKNKLKILLLDNNKERLHNSELLIRCCGDYRVCSRLSVNQHDYESSNYDVIFAHLGNKEVEESIADLDWDSGDAVVIIFSGGFSDSKDKDEGIWYVSAAYMESEENICTLLKEVCKE